MCKKCCKYYPNSHDSRPLLSKILLLPLLVLFLLPVAHAQTDYSGTYYIGAVATSNTPANNFYLCPTEGWKYYDSENTPPYTSTPNGQPFLTTYKCRGTVDYDTSKAIWYIEKHPTSDYYYIRHATDNKYLTYNDAFFSNIGRVRVHLEDSPADNYALFTINYVSSKSCYEIISKKASETQSNEDRIYLNVNKGNKQNLAGDGDAFSGVNTGGVIGLWTAGAAENNGTGRFFLESAISIDLPTITNNFDGTYTISAASGTTIYYTTDNSTPTISHYTGTGTTSVNVNQTASMTVIKAIAKSTSDDFPTAVKTYLLPVCEKPVIIVSGSNVTITCATPGADIYYTTDGTHATTSSTPYSGSFNLGGATFVHAIATSLGYHISREAVYTPPITVHSSDEIVDMSRNYLLASDFNSSASIGTALNPFTGTIDGQMNVFSGLDHPLVAYADGAIIKNVILDNVSIGSGTNVGAICGEAAGATRIYNCGVLATNSTVEKNDDGYDIITSCSSTISGSGYVGGIVGLLDGSSRVINCFSYANVSGGTHAGGIVGYNNVATTASNLQTMVMNCMFYGEVSGSSIAPIYNGQIITNDGDDDGVNNFNYFRLESAYIQNTAITKVYHCALGAETRFLQRFEFFRHLLNSNRELAAWWATGDVDNVDEIMKWVMEPTQIGTSTPYPVLKTPGRYASVVNYTPSTTAYDEANRNKGRKLTSEGDGGVLHVTIQMGTGGARYTAPSGAGLKAGGETVSMDLTITDKDFEHFNFNYGKVQLPYYNDYCEGNYTENRVVTGWKIVSITEGTAGSYSTGDDVTYTDGVLTATPYNFADRKCTNKDLYSQSGRVFNQGAYWDVPEGVTAITIEPYWGRAVYLSDSYWDVTYKNSADNKDAMATASNVTTIGGGQRYINGESTFNDQLVYTSMSNAISSSGSALFSGVDANTHTVYDYAVVLVGNYHQNSSPESSNSKPYTVTSVDLDGDNEPDYSFLLRFNARTLFHPARYDFLNVIGLGMAQKTTGGTGSYNLGIMQPKGWLEVTNTALFRVTQFEYSPAGRSKKPIILQGGVIEQWVTQQQDAGDAVEYFHVGGNVWFKEFHRGSHQDNEEKSTPHPPLSVTGGDFAKFYLTGLYQSQAAIYDDNAECYINGGRFGEVAGAGMEGIGTSNGKGNITWVIDHADIKEFYGGGINFAKPVHGNIHTIISNSHVDLFCGGPKFGDMEDGCTVTTTATNCTFGTYFGAGYGGNSYNRYAPKNQNNKININWNNWVGTEYTRSYNPTYGGVSTQFDYQFIPMSGNLDNVARLFVDFVGFSLATTHNVTSSLTGCTVTSNFYGGGSLGEVDGNVVSTLNDCRVYGNVFGAGYSASLPTVEVMNTGGFPTEPYYYIDLGTYRTGVFPATTTYSWVHADAIGVDNENRILKTTVDLTALGSVTGSATLTLNATTVGTLVAGDLVEGTGNVYGGGEESDVQTNTTVAINGASQVYGNVFGAGKGKNSDYEMALVGGNSTVTMSGAAAHVLHNIYGGGELAMVNGDASVAITAGKVGATDNPASTDGFVFGGGKGTIFDPLFANVKGNTHVTMSGGTVHNTLFGGGELASVGTFTLAETADAVNDIVVGEPISCAAGTGRCLVEISGGQIGHKDATLLHDIGYVFGAGMGVYTDPHAPDEPVASADNARFGYVNTAHVVISDDAFIVGAVWGGSEDGQVLDSCGVVVTGGQIGCGYDWVNEEGLAPYTSTQWTNAINAVKTQNATNINSMAAEMPECHHWPYGRPVLDGNGDPVLDGQGNPVLHYLPYDPYASAYHATDASEQAGDGHTFFGNVFGGGSGYYAYLTDDGAGGYTAEWYRFQGRVRGNSYVEISGGHILTSVYGGCEYADVMGDSRVVMTGGTLGVPRTLDSIRDHPVTAYLFGAGKGDQRTEFNLLTNVQNARVTVTGGVIFGSVFGGSEDGNTLGDAKVNIGGDAWIGTWGTSYVDGNIFGAGRGFSGVSQTSGSVGGNVQVNVSDGRILGSIFGGGRMASVGTYFAAVGDANYGVLKPDDGSNHYGEIRVNITGGTIGNDNYRANPVESTWTGHIVSGNVFGGGMGRYDKDNFIWPMLGRAKRTFVTVNGATVNIQGNVYGGGEIGCVEEDASVEVQDGTVFGSVYGGGFGSRDDEEVSTVLGTLSAATLAGRVEGNTTVAVSGGWIKENVYGGGEIATVGHITDSVKHSDADHSFYLSWPYRMTYADGTGNTAVSITGGRIGISGKDAMEGTGAERIDNGDVYGAGKGLASSRYHEAHLSNVNNSSVTINFTYNDYATPEEIAAAPSNHQLIAGSVYGGAENGHVIGNTSVTLTNGLVGHNIYGGGKGKGEYLQTKLKHLTAGDDGAGHSWAQDDDSSAMIYSVTAGRVYGNTHIVMNNGHVIRNIFGGGNQGSVGVGNFAGGGDDYSANGYGEKVDDNVRPNGLTDADEEYYYNYWDDTVNRGRCIVEVLGGTVGTPGGLKDDLPTGNVFGACRGQAPRQVEPTLTNRWWYVPEYYLGYVNTSYVTIGTAGAGPTIYGSVYGGAQDGHVRNSTTVIVNNGTIGLEPTDANKTAVTTADLADLRWSARGNVFGAGSGIGLYDSDKDGVADSYNNSSGSVTKFTTVTINGGTIHQNVYGGGNLGTVGQPCINCGGVLPTKAQSLSTVIIGDNVGTLTATIGSATGLAASYGGNVYGSSRGMLKASDEASDLTFANTTYTQVDIRPGADIKGSIFGGGENGFVRRETEVNVTGGTVGVDVYGGGQGAYKQTIGLVTYNNDVNSGRVGESTEVNILGGTVNGSVYGGAKASFVLGNTAVNIGYDNEGTGVGTATIAGDVFGANNLAGTPRGNTAVHVYSTGHSGTNGFPTGIAALVAPYDEFTTEDLTINAATQTYALSAVYGGGNLAAHDPTAADGTTLVHVHYCDQNTIRNLYGGGNAADTKNNHIIIEGGRIENVFGGGNGYSATNNHDNPAAPNYNPGANVSRTATTEIHGGIIDNIFGGSNQKGTIGTTVLTTDAESNCELQLANNSYGGGSEADGSGGEIVLGCGTKFENFYAGSRNADIVGDIHLIINGGEYKNVFGGSKGTAEAAADITGNVTVDIYGGSIENLFGGSDINGNITGTITVNVDWGLNNCSDPLSLGYVYGGGYQAPYEPTAAEALAPYYSPMVNIIQCTVNHAVFGGGYGVGSGSSVDAHIGTAERNVSPLVVIGAYRTKDLEGNTLTPSVPNNTVNIGTPLSTSPVSISGDVFGGGNQGPVNGSPRVILQGSRTTVYNNVYGGGNSAAVSGSPIVEVGTDPRLSAPEFSLDGNILTITIHEDATIHYTTNGETPTAGSPEYTGPITLESGTTTVKAIAVKEGYPAPSAVSSRTVVISGE